MSSGVSRGSPLGCVVGILTILPISLAGIGFYGLYRIFQIPTEDRDPGLLQIVASFTFVGLAGTALLIGLSIWLLKRTDWKDYDPEKPFSQM